MVRVSTVSRAGQVDHRFVVSMGGSTPGPVYYTRDTEAGKSVVN